MEIHIALVLFAIVCSVTGQVDDEEINERAEKLARMMQHDGVERVVKLTDKNFKSSLRKFDIVVVLFHAQSNATLLDQEKLVLEVVAKLFGKKGLLSATCNLLKHRELSKLANVSYAGTITIFNHGKPSAYFGQRSPDVMVPYVSKLFEPAVAEILSKTAKKVFDSSPTAKVVAYLQKDSKEHAEYIKTARTFQPVIHFHAVFDAKIAKSMQLKKPNSLLFVKPFEKAIKMPAKVLWREKSLVGFIQTNKRQIIRKMMLENIHEIWSPDTKGLLMVVFAKVQTQDGNRFFSLIKTLARGYSDNQKLNFVWIDPDPFPAMKEYWQSTFNIDPTSASIGAVDLTGQASTWLSKPKDQELKFEDLKAWMNDLLKGNLKMQPMKTQSASASQPATDNQEQKDEL